MRKALCVLSLAAAAAFTANGAQAASNNYYRHHHRLHVHVYSRYNPAAPVDTTAGVAAGTTVGAGAAYGWFGASAVLPATAAGAAAVGGTAGMGAVAAIDSVLEPCRGFHAVFGLNRGACVNGHYVGYGPRVAYYDHNGRPVYER